MILGTNISFMDEYGNGGKERMRRIDLIYVSPNGTKLFRKNNKHVTFFAETKYGDPIETKEELVDLLVKSKIIKVPSTKKYRFS